MLRYIFALIFVVGILDKTPAASPDFENTVLAVLTKAGCNSGACHGAAIGRGGFRLSLFGQNPDADWVEIARSLAGRRIDTVDPENSLLLRKAGESIEHGGGVRLTEADPHWKLLVQWIQDGAPRRDEHSTAKLIGVEIEPKRVAGKTIGDQVQITVWGRFANGARQDLTHLAILQPQDPDGIQLTDATGKVQLRRPGRHVLMARVRDQVATSEIIVPIPTPVQQSDVNTKVGPTNAPSLIDQHIDAQLLELGLTAGPQANDATLLRRLYLDLVGQLPSANEVERFVADADEKKFQRLIEQLLERDDATTKWTHWLATELRMPRLLRMDATGERATTVFSHLWTSVDHGTPLPDLFADMLQAEGRFEENHNVSFYLLANDGRQQAEQFAELFLGVRMGCANCHNHPLDKWTQDDYHGLAAIFAGIRRNDQITWRPGAMNMHPGTGSAATLQLPNGQQLSDDQDPRPALSDWVRSEGRSLISQSWTNRVWSALFGIGLVDPVDDLRATNPPTHPELLVELADRWQANGGDLKWLLREIVSTKAYQRASLTPPAETTSMEQSLAIAAYGYRTPKPLEPSVLMDVFSQATDVWKSVGVHPAGTRSVSVLLADQTREGNNGGNGCAAGNCQSDLADTLAGKLALIAGPIVNDRLTSPNGRVAAWANDRSMSDEKLIETMYLNYFSRCPTLEESNRWTKFLHDADDRKQMIEDIAWSMLTSTQFLMNY